MKGAQWLPILSIIKISLNFSNLHIFNFHQIPFSFAKGFNHIIMRYCINVLSWYKKSFLSNPDIDQMTILTIHWFPFGSSVCYIITFLQPVAIFTSSFTLVIICIERYPVHIQGRNHKPWCQVSHHSPPTQEKIAKLEAADLLHLVPWLPCFHTRCPSGQVWDSTGWWTSSVLQGD